MSNVKKTTITLHDENVMLKKTTEALKLCVQALLLLQPNMDPEAPCIVYEAYEAANKALDIIPKPEPP